MISSNLNNILRLYNDGKMPHAFLIETNNMPKCLFEINCLIKEILCKKNYIINCTECNLCRLIDKQNLPSVRYINSNGLIIKKEQILEVINYFKSVPQYSEASFYIINGADLLNSSSANTLLKFLEEPFENIYSFLITTNISNVISTISSRCEKIIVKYNENNELQNLELSPNDNKLFIEITECLIQDFNNKESILINTKKGFNNLFNNKADIIRVLKYINIILYNNYYYKVCNIYKDIIPFNNKLLESISKERLFKLIKIIDLTIEKCKYNLNMELLIDTMLIEIGDINE